MKEKIIENGIEYVKSCDYYIPNLKAPEETYNIGKYGRLHSIFIKENRPCLYSMKMLNGTWLAYLEEIDTSAKEMIDKLVKDMAISQEATAERKVRWIYMLKQVNIPIEVLTPTFDKDNLNFEIITQLNKTLNEISIEPIFSKVTTFKLERVNPPMNNNTHSTKRFRRYHLSSNNLREENDKISSFHI